MANLKRNVIPAKAGIQRRASARQKYSKHETFSLYHTFSDLYARYRSRWIPAFAGMASFLNGSQRRTIFILLACLLLALPLNACGKRPAHVDPPEGVVDDTYPLTYPDPKTDPPPSQPSQ
jgi:hypothetical protein